MDDYGKRVREGRIANGVSASEMARLMGLSVQFVSDVERGFRAPFTHEHAPVVSRATGISEDELLLAWAEHVLGGADVLDKVVAANARRRAPEPPGVVSQVRALDEFFGEMRVFRSHDYPRPKRGGR